MRCRLAMYLPLLGVSFLQRHGRLVTIITTATICSVLLTMRLSREFQLRHAVLCGKQGLEALGAIEPGVGQTQQRGRPTSKIILAGQLISEGTTWIREETTDWQNAIYYVNLPSNALSSSGLRTKMNKANEATPYITYIVDNYPYFPDIMAFVHAHRESWHNEDPINNNVHMLNALRLATVLERGFVNMRCNTTPGCPNEVQPFRDPPRKDGRTEQAYPYFYTKFFNLSIAEMQERVPVVAVHGNAQFAVTRAQVLAKPRSEYQRYLKILEETDHDNKTAGMVME